MYSSRRNYKDIPEDGRRRREEKMGGGDEEKTGGGDEEEKKYSIFLSLISCQDPRHHE